MKILISLSSRLLPFYRDCTQFSDYACNKDGGLNDCISQAREITWNTFKSKVNGDDYAASFHKSKLFGKLMYYIKQSSIEYLFMGH